MIVSYFKVLLKDNYIIFKFIVYMYWKYDYAVDFSIRSFLIFYSQFVAHTSKLSLLYREIASKY